MENNNFKVPSIGSKVYLDGKVAKKVTVQAIETKSFCTFIKFKEVPGKEFCWDFLAQVQDRLAQQFNN